MSDYIIAYRPTSNILDRIQEYADILEKWSYNDYDEYLFMLDESLSENMDFKKWLSNQTYNKSRGTVINVFGQNTVDNWMKNDINLRETYTIHELLEDKPIADLIHSESFGGDVRKYINPRYGGVSRFSIDFKLFRTRDIRITGMEPMSIDSIKKLIDLNVCSNNTQRGQNPRYPPAARLVEWADIVKNKWDLECGANGSLHISGNDRTEMEVGFSGFIIYDANQKVEEWCDKKWYDVGNRSNRHNLDYPYMYPDEYDLRSHDEEYTPRSAIRMWWD